MSEKLQKYNPPFLIRIYKVILGGFFNPGVSLRLSGLSKAKI